jgi:hypothetical protein
LNLFTRFLTSRISGWLAILGLIGVVVLGSLITSGVYHYKNLQAKAAFCEGQLASHQIIRDLQERAVEAVDKTADETIDEIEDVANTQRQRRRQAEAAGVEAPSGCANERAPESILRYHGWVPDQ